MPGIPMRSGGPKARIAVIPGDGVGAEVTPQAVKVLKAVCASADRELEFVEFDWGAEKYLREGVTLPNGAVALLRDEFDAILFGALGDPRVPSNQHAADILLGLRFKLDLYVNARPVELLDDRLTPLRDRTEKDIRLIVFRENTEGLYVGVGGVFKPDTPEEVAVQEDINSRKGVERILRYAFEYARQNRLKRLCMSDKSNAMTFAHGLCLAPSGNIHPGKTSLFEPVHGSAPNIAGKGLANPLGAVLASAMMLEFLGWKPQAAAMRAAVQAALRENYVTRDLGGEKNTVGVGDWLANFVEKNHPAKQLR